MGRTRSIYAKKVAVDVFDGRENYPQYTTGRAISTATKTQRKVWEDWKAFERLPVVYQGKSRETLPAVNRGQRRGDAVTLWCSTPGSEPKAE